MANKYLFIFLIILIFAVNCKSLNKDTHNDANISGIQEENIEDEIMLSENESNTEQIENNRDINLLEVISTSELITSIYDNLPSGIRLITRDDEIIFYFYDLDFDSIHEVFVLGIQYDDDMDLNSLVDYSSLFAEDRKPYHFYLYIFSAKEAVSLLDTVDLGMQYVFDNLKRFKINNSFDAPFVVCVTFQVQEGEIQKWLVFDNRLEPELIVSLEDTFSNKLVIEDIDSDGNIDIVIMERGAEEGTGFETFLTWLKWDGSSFKEYAAVNIVRNLKTFLSNSRNYILEHDWARLINNCFNNITYYTNKGWSYTDIVFKALGFEDIYGENQNDKSAVLSGTHGVVFPEIFENPFILEDEAGLYFNLTFRIEDANGITIISELSVYMNRNPFGSKQFYFRMR